MTCAHDRAGRRDFHCAACCETFTGLGLFDSHQRILTSQGRAQVICRDPAAITDRAGRFVMRQRPDGRWSSAKELPPEALAALAGRQYRDG
jgi:hypothetical protein